MYGGRQFVFGLLLGGLGIAFAQTKDGRQMIGKAAQALSCAVQHTINTANSGDEKERQNDAREDHEDQGEGSV